MKIMIVLPTYNESENIGRMIESILSLEGSPDCVSRGVDRIGIAVVDDSSPDGTGKIVAGLAKKHPDRIHLIERKEKGRGTAGIAGFQYALTQDVDGIIEMDADFSHDPLDIPRLAAEIKQYDIAIGSRFLPGSKIGARSPLRTLTSWAAEHYARLILRIGIHDWSGGYKCYRKSALAGLDLLRVRSRGYSIGIETLYMLIRGGCTYREIPITFRDREAGKSKFKTKESLDYVRMAWQLRFSPSADDTLNA
jgi:dolichol-phosphate mannosyltransferase